MKLKKKTFWLLYPFILFVIIAAIVLSGADIKKVKDEYNDGNCFCGGRFHLVMQYNSGDYLYECDSCGKTIYSLRRLK